jgi:hypothetical protein
VLAPVQGHAEKCSAGQQEIQQPAIVVDLVAVGEMFGEISRRLVEFGAEGREPAKHVVESADMRTDERIVAASSSSPWSWGHA